jgi:LPS-assembly protein
MSKTSRLIITILALVSVFGSMTSGQAAASNSEAATKVPIVIEGEQVSFSDVTGEIFAEGNVVLTQNGDTVMGETIRGNVKSHDVWIEGKGTILRPGLKADVDGAHYNYNLKSGELNKANGKIEHGFFTSANLSVDPKELVLQEGTITGCPDKVPHYHVSADKIEVWPGEKIIAYNAKFWVGKKAIFTLPRYQRSLKPGQHKESSFPSIGYNSTDGISIKQYLEFPTSPSFALFADLDYYSKQGFKPYYGAIYHRSDYDISVKQGDFQDSNNNWITKEPELNFNLFNRRLGTLPYNYKFDAVYGKWVDNVKSSWHQEYNFYINHDTIELSPSSKLDLGLGFSQVRESYDQSVVNRLKFDSNLAKIWSPRFSGWIGYHYLQNNNATVFSYDSDDVGRKIDTGISFQISNKDRIIINPIYSIDTDSFKDLDYTWRRNLHCWEADFTYRAKRDQYRVTVRALEF